MSRIFASTSENRPGAGAGPVFGRIAFFDLWRSLCVWMMLAYHISYDLMLFGVLPEAVVTHPAARIYCYLGAGGFILLSGVCVRFSRDPVRRGILVFCAGLAVTAATALAGYPAVFGILHLLGCCMMFYGLLRKGLAHRLGPVCMAACLVLFAGTWILTGSVTVDARWLYPIGFRYPGFYSSDYFPLLPWGFLFLAGACLGKQLDDRRDAPVWQRRFPSALTFCGRHSLGIYLLHQPVIYGILRLLFQTERPL